MADPIDAEPLDTNESHGGRVLAMRSPQIPITLSELAALKGDATAVIEARVQVIKTCRKESLRLTGPPDWVLHKAPDEHGGQVIGYLQDAGADRVRDVWGVEIYGISEPEKIVGAEPDVYHYIVKGSGRCKLTGQVVENMEGGRSSTDDFCKDRQGLERELLVRKAARANLDGGITRELTGMKSVPVEELREAWVGTTKRIEQCRLGRGFGTRSERLGARAEKAPDIDPPVCPHCKTPGVYRPAKDDRKAFYGCPNYTKHPQKKFIVDAAEWIAAKQPTPAAAPAAAAAAAHPPANGAPPTAGEIFKREPGEDG